MGKTYKKNGKNRFEKKKLLATKHKKKYPKREKEDEDTEVEEEIFNHERSIS